MSPSSILNEEKQIEESYNSSNFRTITLIYELALCCKYIIKARQLKDHKKSLMSVVFFSVLFPNETRSCNVKMLKDETFSFNRAFDWTIKKSGIGKVFLIISELSLKRCIYLIKIQ